MRRTTKTYFSSDITMKAFIVYADFASAANASATIRRVGASGDVRVRWIIKCWQVNVLREPGPFENALIDAADAHLILFAERHSQFIPSWICDWLKRWAVLRQIQNAALAVIGDGTSLTLPVNSELILLAEQLGLNFIAGNGATVKNAIRVHSGAPVSDFSGVRGQRGACPALVNGRGSLVEPNIKLMMTENRKGN